MNSSVLIPSASIILKNVSLLGWCLPLSNENICRSESSHRAASSLAESDFSFLTSFNVFGKASLNVMCPDKNQKGHTFRRDGAVKLEEIKDQVNDGKVFFTPSNYNVVMLQ